MEQNQNNPKNITHSTTVVIHSKKSTGVAFLLAFLFGPLGLLYASGLGGLVMFILSIILFFILPIIGPILCWIASIIWAVSAVRNSTTSSVTVNHSST